MKLLYVVLLAGIVCVSSTGYKHKYLTMDSDQIDSEEHGVTVGTNPTTCKCGWANRATSRIVGGQESEINQFPFIAAIINWKKRILHIFCGGTIITEYHVLTAAHCTDGEKVEKLAVIIGEHNIQQADETDATKRIKVKAIKQHAEYEYKNKLNDIALIELAEKITFSDKVGPACLPRERDSYDLIDKYIKVMGWGDIRTDGSGSKWLLHTNLRVIPLEDCKKSYKSLISTTDPKQICTFSKGRDSCQGDSGGPLVYVDPETNRYTLIGLVSYGLICADKPGVNIDVSAYLDWIQENIRNTNPNGTTCTKI